MNFIPLPSNLKIVDHDNKSSLVELNPCYPGYGTTIGNAIRRVLLSSIPGAAVTSFKIKGVLHEFSSIDNVKEDAVEIILNIKKLRFKIFTDETVILTLHVKGDKVVTGADIDKNSQVEVVSPDQPICTLTSKSAEINMEFKVKRGFGYITVEEREKEKMDVGEIMVDSLFSPIVNVGINIDNVRVGDMTNYEKLTLNISTDGSIKGSEAVAIATDILDKHFNLFNSQLQEGSNDQEVEIVEDDNSNSNNEEEVVQTPAKKRGRKASA